MGYAQKTSVPVERSRAEIEKIVSRYGARKFASGWDADRAAIQFAASGRMVKFVLPLPAEADAKKALLKRRGCPWGGPTQASITNWVDSESRRRWRCLLLAIKSKLEVVETGIETFEQAFLANIVTDDGQTVHERMFAVDSRIKLLAAAGEP